MTLPMRWLWRARVPDIREGEWLIDGDTVRLEIDRGLDGTKTVLPIRLKDTRAPEEGQRGYEQTVTRVNAWVYEFPQSTWPFIVETFRTRGDRDIKSLSRYIGIVTRADQTGPSLNDVVNAFVTENGFERGH